MADEKKKEINPDEILERLMQGHQPGGLIRLSGSYLGNSERTGYFRLYLNDRLDSYLEFPKDQTVDAERVNAGRIIVWLKQGAKVTLTKTRVLSEQFLSGDIEGSKRGSASGGFGIPRMLNVAMDESGCGGCTDPACSRSQCSGNPFCPNAPLTNDPCTNVNC